MSSFLLSRRDFFSFRLGLASISTILDESRANWPKIYCQWGVGGSRDPKSSLPRQLLTKLDPLARSCHQTSVHQPSLPCSRPFLLQFQVASIGVVEVCACFLRVPLCSVSLIFLCCHVSFCAFLTLLLCPQLCSCLSLCPQRFPFEFWVGSGQSRLLFLCHPA